MSDYLAVTHMAGPYVTAYPWSGSGFGVKFSDPSVDVAGTGRGVSFSTSGDAIAVSHTSSPYVTAYPWSGSGFGTKFSDPATLPASTGQKLSFGSDAAAIPRTQNYYRLLRL